MANKSHLIEIQTCLQAKNLEKAVNLIKAYGTELDGRTVFKLLRTLSNQQKQGIAPECTELAKLFVTASCDIVIKDANVVSEESELVRGLVAMFHITAYYLDKCTDFSMVMKLSFTMLYCLQQFKKSLKEVESVASNFYLNLWNASSKMGSKSNTCRSLSLRILVHGGSSHWSRLADKLRTATSDKTASSVCLAEEVLDEFMNFIQHHPRDDHLLQISILLQIWTHILYISEPQLQQERTKKLEELSSKLKNSDQFLAVIRIVLSVVGLNSENNLEDNWNKIQPLFVEHLQPLFVCIAFLALRYCYVISNQPVENCNAAQANAVYLVMAQFHDNLELLRKTIEQRQMDTRKLRAQFLPRIFSVSACLLKIDPSNTRNLQSVVLQADQLIETLKDDDQALTTVLSSIEKSAFNAGAHLGNVRQYSNAAHFFRKSIDYVIRNPSFRFADPASRAHLISRMSTLYEYRKAGKEWKNVLQDYQAVLSSCFIQRDKDQILRIRNEARLLVDQLLHIWIQFKRDMYSISPTESQILEITVVDLLNQSSSAKLEKHMAWDLLHGELLAFDRRKGPVPKSAISAVVKQAKSRAETGLQKAISLFYLCREEGDLPSKLNWAKKAVSELERLAETHPDAQLYLAMSYVEHYVVLQEILKEKTKEEMESLGPLIKSSTNAEVPQGEDGTCYMSDGASLDAVSYSYLKLEQEFKNQTWMVKSLEMFEELLQSGWSIDHYRKTVFNCLKSIGYYFSLCGSSFFSVRAWILLQKLSVNANVDDEYLISVSELLKRRWIVENSVLQKCEEIIGKEVLAQDQVLFHLSLAWAKYFQQSFQECWRILYCKVFESPLLNTDLPTKSVLILQAQAHLLHSLLLLLPPSLIQLQLHPSGTPALGPVSVALKATQGAFTGLKCYKTTGWEFYGQEWYVLDVFITCAVYTARLHMYTAAPREARWFVKEALKIAQQHALVLRTAEILLELCNIDLVLDNTMDCQSKLVLICHLMGVPHPVRPAELPSGVKTPVSGRPTSPVFVHANDRPRRGYQSKKVPETSVPVQQDATNRYLQVPFMNQGASPTTKVRELCSGLFPDHSTDCYCITCSSELVFVVRCSAFMIQAKLWSVLGFHNEADEEFQRGQQFVQSLCSRMRVAKANKAAVNLFNAPTQLKLQNAWNDRKVEWLQSVILSVADLILEQSIHCGAYEKCDEAMELLEQGKDFLLNFFIGPIEHRGLKTIAKLNLIRCNLTDREAVDKHLQVEDSEDEVLVLEPTSQAALAPKTPAPSCRRMADAAPPIQKRFGRQSRPKTIDLDSPITITIEDDSEDDFQFARRRLGKPQQPALLSSSESEDEDVLPATPPPPPPLPTKRREPATRKKKEEVVKSTTASTSTRRGARREVLDEEELTARLTAVRLEAEAEQKERPKRNLRSAKK